MEDRLAVAALGGGGQAEQDPGGEVLEERGVGGRFGVVELIDDHDVVGVGFEALEPALVQGLDGGEDVAADEGLVASSEQLAETAIAEGGAIGRAALLEDFAPVGHEEQARSDRGFGGGEGLVVQGGHDRLAGPGGGDHQVAVVARSALGGEGVQHGGLVGVGMEPDGGGQRIALGVAASGEDLDEAVAVVGLEGALVPVLVEGGFELPEDGPVVDLRQAHVPLAAIAERGVGEVRGADDAGGEAGRAVEEPGLGVEAGAAGVVADADFGPERLQGVEGFVVGRAHVGGGQDAERGAALPVAQGAQGVAELDEAGPLHEGHQHVDPVGRDDLALDLAPYPQVLGPVHDQVAVAQGNGRASQLGRAEAHLVAPEYVEQPLGGDLVVGVDDAAEAGEPAEELVGDLDLLGHLVGAFPGDRREHRGREAEHVARQGLGRGVGGEGRALGLERWIGEPPLDLEGNELVVESGRELTHERRLPQDHARGDGMWGTGRRRLRRPGPTWAHGPERSGVGGAAVALLRGAGGAAHRDVAAGGEGGEQGQGQAGHEPQ